jgi:hypothetical protein
MATPGRVVSPEEPPDPPDSVGVSVGTPDSVGTIVGGGLVASSLAPPPQAVKKTEILNRNATKGVGFLTLPAEWRDPLVVSISLP